MPTVRHAKPRGRFVELTDYQLAMLLDQELPEPTPEDQWWWIAQAGADQPTKAWHGLSLSMLWRVNEPTLLSMWIAENPGTRPSCWWDYSAPRAPAGSIPRMSGTWLDGKLAEPRRRLGGKGTPKSEVLAVVPRFAYGVPVDWITAADLQTWPRLTCTPLDPRDPPVFESEAAYLERHNLFSPGERRRLRKADWAPEAVGLS
jgi:hypothetical protein